MKDGLSWCFSEPDYLSVSPPRDNAHRYVTKPMGSKKDKKKNRDTVGETERERDTVGETQGERDRGLMEVGGGGGGQE